MVGTSDEAAPGADRFELRVLGTFEALVGGAPVKLAPMPRRLLAALTLRPGGAVTADVLIDMLWGDAAPSSAASVLRVYVTQLRRALPRGRLLTERAGYRLVVDEGELDSDEFEHLLADGRRTHADGNDRLAHTLFTRALALWQGDAFGGLSDELFVRDEAMRLEELRLQCVEARFESELCLGRHDQLLPDLERLVAEHPVRERLRAQLMTALYRAGRQADALARYREGRAYLDAELGLEPGVELRELERKILGHDSALDRAERPSSGGPSRPAAADPHDRSVERAPFARSAPARSEDASRLAGRARRGGQDASRSAARERPR